jgi:uncharacterized protein involved in exopolysaccharide biosynthesis
MSSVGGVNVAQADVDGGSVAPRDYLRIVRRRWRIVAVVTIIVVAAAVAYS